VFTSLTNGIGFDSAALAAKSLDDTLREGGGSGIQGAVENLLRHGVAAVLNAKALGAGNFGMSEAQVIALVNGAIDSNDITQIQNAQTQLAALNNQPHTACPSSK
jgi:hypothetical protein